jgi:hypothetical protein
MALADGDYVATLALTDTVNAGVNYTIAANENLAVDNRGYQQGALYDLLNNIVTNNNLLTIKIEADGATTTTYTPNNDLTLLAVQGNGLSDKGMHQKDLITQLTEMETKWNAILALLDADGGVTLTTYVAGFTVDLDNTVVGSLGLGQDTLVAFLESFVDNFNLALAQMDVDGA